MNMTEVQATIAKANTIGSGATTAGPKNRNFKRHHLIKFKIEVSKFAIQHGENAAIEKWPDLNPALIATWSKKFLTGEYNGADPNRSRIFFTHADGPTNRGSSAIEDELRARIISQEKIIHELHGALNKLLAKLN